MMSTVMRCEEEFDKDTERDRHTSWVLKGVSTVGLVREEMEPSWKWGNNEQAWRRRKAGAQELPVWNWKVMSWARGVCQRPQWVEHWLAFFRDFILKMTKVSYSISKENWDSFKVNTVQRSLISVIPDPETLRAHTNRIFSVWGNPRESQAS